MNELWFKEVISKKRNGSFDKCLRLLLRVISWLYCFGNFVREIALKTGLRKVYKTDKPVISIGNITTGGTGKTPFVIWVCNYLSGKGFSPAVLTRGYKTGKGKLTDEPAILAKGCEKAKVIVNSNRYQGTKKASDEYACDVMVMDDGFQHRQLARDIDIVLIDGTCPFGYKKLLPAGLLREPLKALKRADAFIITRCDQISEEKIEHIKTELAKINPKADAATALHFPSRIVMLKNQKVEIKDITDKKIFVFCGIGNPEAFLKTVTDLQLDIAGHKIYNDHHNYSSTDLQDIYEQAKYLDADIILTTQKDWVKTALLSLAENDIKFAYLDIEMKFVQDGDKIISLINRAIGNNNDK